MNTLFRSTRARIVAGAMALLLGGGILGAVLATAIPAAAAGHTANTTLNPGATTPATNQYCTLYEQTLAQKLGISVSALESDNVAALKTVIAQMVKDGKLTQTQADAITKQLDANGTNICNHLGQLKGMGGHGNIGAFGAQLKQVRTDVQTAVAKQLGYTDAAALETALDSNNGDIVALAKTKNITQAQVNTTISATVKTDLDALVKAGTLTSTQETQAQTMVQSQIAAGHYALFFGGRGHHGFHP
ncbi:MAG: hypothetical protein H0X24_18845 [Ktedonobacterales bacterium]|nr:hypothetical protein [Ktedonobacterales bacterium]